MDEYVVVQSDVKRIMDVLTTQDKVQAFKRFRDLVASGEGTKVTLWSESTREFLAVAEYSAAKEA